MKFVLCALVIALTGCGTTGSHRIGGAFQNLGAGISGGSHNSPPTNNIPAIQPYQSIYPTSNNPMAKTCVTQFGQTRCSQ